MMLIYILIIIHWLSNITYVVFELYSFLTYMFMVFALYPFARGYNNREHKWQCKDIEIQRLVVRSLDAFLDGTTSETSQHQLVKVFKNLLY